LPRINKKKIVIDANVARSAGGKNIHPSVPSENCTLFLKKVIEKNKMYVLFDQNLLLEWKNHASAYAKKWLLELTARKRNEKIDEELLQNKKTELSKCLKTHGNELKHAKKDAHIIVLSLTSKHCPIISLEKKCFKDFKSVSERAGCKFLKDIVSFNPEEMSPSEINNFFDF
jgi:hypothetical protein